MITTKIPSYEIYRIATRPVVMTSLVKMLDYLDINIDQKIFFNAEAEVSKLLGGDASGKRGSNIGTDYGYDNKLFIEFENNSAEYNDELDTYTGDYSNPALWYDPITKSRIAGKFKTRKYEITVNAYFKDRVTAQRYLTNIESKTLGVHQNTDFEFDTHYPTTYPQLQCFKEIYDRLINANAIESTVGFIDWMIANSTVPCGILRNVVFNNPAFVFKQRISNINVIMENPTLAKVTSGSFIGKYEVAFRYYFYFSEHIEWVMNYPIQIYQQLMPADYLPEVFTENKMEPTRRRFFESAAANLIWNKDRNRAPFYQIFPNQDNWRPKDIYWISPQLQVLTNVENVEHQVLINMKDIHGFTWNKTVIDYIIKYRDKVTRRHASPLNIKVWSDDNEQSIEVLESRLVLDINGDLVMTVPPVMGNTYRIVFSFDYALRLYNDEAINDLLDDPEYAKWIIGLLFPQYPWPDDWKGTWSDWANIYDGINIGDGLPMEFWMPYGMLYSSIVARNSDSYAEYIQLVNKGITDGSDYNW